MGPAIAELLCGNQSAQQAVVYDFNGDGKLDLAVVNGLSNDLSILLGKGDGTFATAVNYPAGLTGAGQIAAADFNGDGSGDLVVSGTSSISVLLNKGNGTFGAALTGLRAYPDRVICLVQNLVNVKALDIVMTGNSVAVDTRIVGEAS
jgi:hypothetical protein